MGTGDPMEGCSVCADDTGTEENPLVYCDGYGCNVCVHKACYGIRSIPTGDWFCGKCVFLRQHPGGLTELGGIASAASGVDFEKRTVSCQLCPSKEGALKPTDDGKWAHVVCALYIREVDFKDKEVMEPIVISGIPKDRFQQTCCICLVEAEARSGACTNCEKSGCRKVFHVTCAQRKGLLCEITRKNNKLQVLYSGYCTDHIPSVESGIVDNSRFRKIPPYPRVSQPSSGAATQQQQAERASSSSGYSTPNNPEKSPVSQTQQQQPSATATTTSNQADQNQPPPVMVGEPDNQRSSSIKSNASVGSSGTTESADSGIHSSSVPGDRVTVAAVATGQQQQEEQRQIRKPPKKAFAARGMMEGGGVPSPGPAPSSMPPFQSQVPHPSPGSGNSQGDPAARYYASNPFATPHEMPSQFDLPRPSSGQPMATASLAMKQQQENARMSPYLPGKPLSGHSLDRPTPPPLRKRALSPSILDNETLTISSLIERTIERATTSTASVPPISASFTPSGVRPPGEEAPSVPPAAAPVKNEPAPKKPKRTPKEPKADPRRSGNTATIKDLLASSNLSPQQQQQQGLHSPAPETPTVNKAPTPKPKPPTSSVSGLSAFAGGNNMDMDRTNHSDSPFSSNRERAAMSPKSLMMRQQDDRHRHAVEKVQNYLNNNVPLEGPASSDQQSRPLPNSTPANSGSAGKGKRKTQEDRGRAPAQKGNAHPSASYAPSPSDNASTRTAPPPTSGPRGGGGGEEHNRKTNGYVNGNNELADDDVDTPVGAQAFDSFMMALSTFGMSAAHQSAMNSHPTAATTLDGFFRMQKELNILKQKVGELEGLKAFYLTQVQALRSLASKHQSDPTYPVVQPTMPEEVSRLLSVLGGDPSASPRAEEPHRSHPKQERPVENASDGLSARLHEPTAPTSRDSSQQRSSRDTRPDSRVPASSSSQLGPPTGAGYHMTPHGLMQTQSPSSTPKPSSRSRGAPANREPERGGGGEREREYVNGTGHSTSSSSNRRQGGGGQYPHLDHMDGVASGVISTPAPVVSAPQLINMSNMAGGPFLMQNPQLYSMIDPRMFGIMPGQGGFFPSGYAQGMGGFMPSANPADYAGLGRMHTPTSMSGRYQLDDGNGSSSNASQHSSMKREQYEMSRGEN